MFRKTKFDKEITRWYTVDIAVMFGGNDEISRGMDRKTQKKSVVCAGIKPCGHGGAVFHHASVF